MIRDIDLNTRKTYIFASKTEALFPATDLYPAPDLYPSGSDSFQLDGNIVAGTMVLDEILLDGDDISFGDLYSDKFEVTLYDVPDLAGYYIYVYQIDNEQIKFIFTGVVESSKKNRDGLDRKVVAYDNAYRYGNKNVVDWWTDFWTNRQYATLVTMRQSLLKYFDISYEDVVLPNDNLQVTKNADISCVTFSAMIKMLCEPNCCFPHFSRNGELRFIVFDDEVTPTNITNLYEGENSEFEDYITDTITGIQFLDSDGKVKYEVGNTSNMYAMSKDNILLYDCSTDDLTSIGNNMLSYISDISFTPCTVKMICGDLDYTLGKRMITENNQEFYIMENNYSGSQLVEQTMIARGKQYLDTEARALKTSAITLNEKISRLTVDVEHFEIEYGNFKTETNTKFTQTADSISSKVSKGDVSSEISQESDLISITSNRIEIQSDNFTLDQDGNITANEAVLTNATVSGELTTGENGNYMHIDGGVIQAYYNHTSTGRIGFSEHFSDISGYTTFITNENVAIHGNLFIARDDGGNTYWVASESGQVLTDIETENYQFLTSDFYFNFEWARVSTPDGGWQEVLSGYDYSFPNQTGTYIPHLYWRNYLNGVII